jgi:hypothetical protein
LLETATTSRSSRRGATGFVVPWLGWAPSPGRVRKLPAACGNEG